MAKRRKPSPPKRQTSGTAGEADLPSLIELDRFSSASLNQWKVAATRLDALHRALYFGLESLRLQDSARLIDAVRAGAREGSSFDDWSRITDYQFSLAPLSLDGSLRGDGGRFNIGRGLSPGSFTAFPSLYVADGYPTAYLERFGLLPSAKRGGLSGEEFALRKPQSFTQVRVRGYLENVFDVGDIAALRLVVDIIKEFKTPKSVVQTARQLGLRQSPWLIRSAVTLQRQLLHANWRMSPVQFDLPSNSQIFGRLASAAGVHGILYPSAKDSVHGHVSAKLVWL
jgi:hypothetical protein